MEEQDPGVHSGSAGSDLMQLPLSLGAGLSFDLGVSPALLVHLGVSPALLVHFAYHTPLLVCADVDQKVWRSKDI